MNIDRSMTATVSIKELVDLLKGSTDDLSVQALPSDGGGVKMILSGGNSHVILTYTFRKQA